ncbi:MAG: hypothetical protein ACO29X_02160 [Arcobacteraceae bacterium]|jgi:hypothetical protein
MEEIIVTKYQLSEMYASGEIEDSSFGWLYQNQFYIHIIALHEKDLDYVSDVTDAEYYKISLIRQK